MFLFNNYEGIIMKYFTYIIFVLLISCSKGRKESVIQIDVDNEKEIPLSKYVDSVNIVPLETSQYCRIGSISQIAIDGDVIYVLDNITNSVFKFAKDGEYISKFKLKCDSCNYMRLTDLKVKGNKIYVSDFSSGRILIYDKKFNFTAAVNLKISPVSFNVIDDNKYIVYTIPDEKNNKFFYVVDKNGNILNSCVSRTFGAYHWICSNVFGFCCKKYLLSGHSNCIYTLEDNNITGSTVLNFGKYTFADKSNLSKPDICTCNFTKKYCITNGLFVLKNNVVISYMNRCKRRYIFMDSCKCVYGQVHNDVVENFRFMVKTSASGELIDIATPELLLGSYPEVIKKNKKLRNIAPSGNPILFIYR